MPNQYELPNFLLHISQEMIFLRECLLRCILECVAQEKILEHLSHLSDLN